MKKTIEEKYLHRGWATLLVAVIGITWFFMLYKLPLLLKILRKGIGILKPFIYGFIMAYLLLPVFDRIRKILSPQFYRFIKNEKRAKATCGLFSSILSVGLFFGLVSALLAAVIPQLYTSLMSLANNMQDHLLEIDRWIERLFDGDFFRESGLRAVYDEGQLVLTQWAREDMLPWMLEMMSGSVAGLINALSTMLMAVIIAVYMLFGKDTFVAQGKKIIYALCSAHTGNLLLDNLRYTHKVFGGFISGKLLDSLIIGIITFVGLTLLKMPYIVLISVVVGVTNVIPYFGPFIGAIPSAILILLIDPVKAVYFVVFILIVQQFDGNVLGPKILGDSIGLSSFWVMFAIFVFGGAMGFTGMVLGVPMMAIIYSTVSALLHRQLKRKGMPYQTEDYVDMEAIDPDTHAVVKYSEIRRAPPESVVLKKQTKKDE